jgi:hypothetical protein
MALLVLALGASVTALGLIDLPASIERWDRNRHAGD